MESDHTILFALGVLLGVVACLIVVIRWIEKRDMEKAIEEIRRGGKR